MYSSSRSWSHSRRRSEEERPGTPGVLLPLKRSTRRTSIHIGARHKDQLPAQPVELLLGSARLQHPPADPRHIVRQTSSREPQSSNAANSSRNDRSTGPHRRRPSAAITAGSKGLPRMRPSSRSLATGHLFEVFRIPIPFNLDLRGGTVDLAQIVCSQFNPERAYILLQPRQLGRTRNRNNPWFLCEQPGQSNLSRRRVLTLCDRSAWPKRKLDLRSPC